MSAADGVPNPVDLYVGGQVRLRRKHLKLSQEGLADAIGLTFQQVQKYERGVNRISASKLHHIGQVLKVPIQYFFDGYEPAGATLVESDSEKTVNGFLATSEGIELAEAFPRIKDARQRRQVLALVRSLSDDEEVLEAPQLQES